MSDATHCPRRCQTDDKNPVVARLVLRLAHKIMHQLKTVRTRLRELASDTSVFHIIPLTDAMTLPYRI